VNVHETRLDNDNVMDIFSQYDLIVDGTDNFATRYMVNDACVLLNKPYVWDYYRFDGQASVFGVNTDPAIAAFIQSHLPWDGSIVCRRWRAGRSLCVDWNQFKLTRQ
jgi:molybdopterin/thiamine biosynthesis adenylyltransferase